MKSTYYSVAWTECGCFISCSHEHETIVEAEFCIPCAGGYVVGVENGVMRSLTAEEEAEFQRAHYALRYDKPASDAATPVSAEKASSDPRYAVMTPIWGSITGLGRRGCVLTPMRKRWHTLEEATRWCVLHPKSGRH